MGRNELLTRCVQVFVLFLSAVSLQKALPFDKNPEALLLAGRSALTLGHKEQDIKKTEEAAAFFKQFLRQIPDSGRGWFYLGMANLELEGRPAPVTAEAWNANKALFLRAIHFAPGDPWIAYHSGVQFLRHKNFLMPKEKKFAVDLIRQSIQAHQYQLPSIYLPKPSPFLRPALEFLWKQDRNFKTLRLIVPHDFPSYKTFLEFLQEKKLWKEDATIFQEYSNLLENFYDSQCALGENFLAEGKYRQALIEFRKAFWSRSWDYFRAKAGILASLAEMGELPARYLDLFQEDYHLTLKKILEERDENFGTVMKYLKPVMQKAHDPYLTELYDSRMGKAPKTSPVDAEAYTSSLKPESWWGNVEANHLVRKTGRISTSINLKSGNSVFHLHLRSRGKPAYVAVYLNGRIFEKIFRVNRSWKPVPFTIRTTGGKRWLQIELINAEKTGGPVLELGNLEISH